jgi:hypothetical protein
MPRLSKFATDEERRLNRNKTKREYRAKNKERVKKIVKKSRAKHKEKIKNSYTLEMTRLKFLFRGI